MGSVTSRSHGIKRNRAQLWAFFALIIYAPLPLGSNRPWALALLGLLTGCLLIWNLWRPGKASVTPVWESARVPFALLGLWLALLVIQIIPMPSGWVGALGQNALGESDGLNSTLATISIDPYSTRLYLFKACILTGVFWLSCNLIDSRSRIESLARVIVFSGLLQAMIGVILMASGVSYFLFFAEMASARGHGTFVSPNNFAGYLELTLAVGIGFMIAKLDGYPVANWRARLHGLMLVLVSEKALLRLSLIIMVVGLVASRSRMGNAAFFASLLIVGIFTIFFAKHATHHVHDMREKNTLRATIVFIASLVIIDVFIIGGVVGVEQVVQRLEHTNLVMRANEAPVGPNGAAAKVYVQEESMEQRSEVARYALSLVRDYPWMGTGGGTFHLAFAHYQPPELKGFVDHAHNDFVEFASEVGLPGFLILALLVAHSAWSSIVLLLRSHDQLVRGMAFASLMGLISLLIHGAVDFNFQIPANALLFIVILSFPYLIRVLKR